MSHYIILIIYPPPSYPRKILSLFSTIYKNGHDEGNKNGIAVKTGKIPCLNIRFTIYVTYDNEKGIVIFKGYNISINKKFF